MEVYLSRGYATLIEKQSSQPNQYHLCQIKIAAISFQVEKHVWVDSGTCNQFLEINFYNQFLQISETDSSDSASPNISVMQM